MRWLVTGRLAFREFGRLPAAARFAGRRLQASWAIEDAGGLGSPLAARLSADDIAVVDVPVKLAARVWLLCTGQAAKAMPLMPPR